MWDEDVLKVLVDAGVGTYGVDLFISSKAKIPSGDGPYISIVETGGSGPDYIHNKIDGPAYQIPGASITVRATDQAAARLKAKEAYDALAGVRNETVNSSRYISIRPNQEPYDLGTEEGTGRALVVFNVLGRKAYS